MWLVARTPGQPLTLNPTPLSRRQFQGLHPHHGNCMALVLSANTPQRQKDFIPTLFLHCENLGTAQGSQGRRWS